MYCTNCGTKASKTAKYCSKCGCPVNDNEEINRFIMPQQPVMNNEVTQNNSDKKKRLGAIFIALGIGFVGVVLVVGFLVIIGSVILSVQDAEFVDLGKTEVESFFHVVEEGELCGFSNNYSNGDVEVEHSVCSYDNFKDEANEYFDYMIDTYGYRDVVSGKYRSIVKRDGDSKYLIRITIDLEDLEITYERYYNENYLEENNDNKEESNQEENNGLENNGNEVPVQTPVMFIMP